MKKKKSMPLKVAFHKDCFVCRKCFDYPVQWDTHIHGKFHYKEYTRHSMKISILHKEVKDNHMPIDIIVEDDIETEI